MLEKTFLNMNGKVAIVTGSSAGIGEAIALEFARQGCHLTLCGRDEKRLDQVEKKCLSEGNGQIKIEKVCGDIVETDVQKRIIEVTFRAFGKIDILVNNAGVSKVRNPTNTERDVYNFIMRTNMESVFFLTQMAIPYLIKTQGSVVNISSIASNKAVPAYTVYGMSKAAMDSFTMTLSLHLAQHKVRVNSVNPASVESLIYRRGSEAMTDEQYEQFKKRQSSHELHPLGGMVKASQVADAVVYLASERASFITGQIVFVDGGRNNVAPQARL